MSRRMAASFISAVQSVKIIINLAEFQEKSSGQLHHANHTARYEEMERSFVMIKPDGVSRGLVGEIIGRLEKRGLKLLAARLEKLTPERVNSQYEEHLNKPFFPSLRNYIMSGPCFLMVWEGRGAVGIIRTIVGKTNPVDAAPGTIRGDYALDLGRNVVHSSDSPESGNKEILIHFKETELTSYPRCSDPWLYE